MIFFLPLGFILGALAIIFILQNNTFVELAFLGFQFESSLAIVVFLAILSGILLTLLLSLPGAIGNMVRIQGLKKENRQLRDHVDTVTANAEPVQIVEETIIRPL